MGSEVLYVQGHAGQFTPASEALVVDAAKRYLRGRMRRGIRLSSPVLVRDFLITRLAERDCEYFCVMFLDAQHRFLRFVELFRGTIDRATVHPREVVRQTLEAHAAAVILVHNHPSQVGEPSAADELITRRLVEALTLIDVRVLDHLIVAGTEVTSFVERGLL